MPSFLLHTLLRAAALTACATGPALAQTTEPHNPAIDTLQPANVKEHYPVSRLVTMKGQQFYVFITGVSGRGNGIEFTWRNPLGLPHPRPVFITSEQVRWVGMRGGYFEPVRVAGEGAGQLARRISEGPQVELFDVATRKKGVPIPVPGLIFMPIIWTGAFREQYNHTYYLRRPGETLMVAVPDNKKFGPFMAGYLADMPTLADSVRTGAKGYRYDDVPRLLVRYKTLPPASGGR